MITAHEHPPYVHHRQMHILVPGKVGRPHEHAEIHQPFVQLFRHLGRITAEKVIGYMRMCSGKAACRSRNDAHGAAFPAAYIYVAAYLLIRRTELLHRSVGKGHDFLRPLAQEHALFRQHHPPPSAQKQFFAEFLLQIHDLAGKRRLCDVQKFRRS